MRLPLVPLLGLVAIANAWLPSDNNLFREESQNATFSNLATGKGRVVKKWLPSLGKIRGVNLGSMFVIEPWMASTEWATMGCSGLKSEFDCVSKLGQDVANTRFKEHWARWITETDIQTMKDYGLNTIRVPVGYWIDESLVYSDSEHFPQGGLAYLDKVVGWAADRDIYVIMDLHGAPGAQVARQPFTGQYAPSAGFYQDYQYERAYKFLQFISNRIHSNNAYRTVGMLEVVNEPISGQSSLVNTYYPTAYSKIRATESSLGVSDNNKLHIQFMNKLWGSGDPKSNLPDQTKVAFDNHRYLKWDSSVPTTQTGYISASCADEVATDGDTPLIVGEWSISPADAVESSSAFEVSSGANSAFYTKWWAAQVMAYEKQLGWVFWSWKSELGNDYRWSYKGAVEAGIIPKDPAQAYNQDVC